jgi:hypothetical protein
LVPLFDRLVVKIDSEWLDFLLHLSPYFSPLHWTSYDWGAVAVQTAIIAIAADLLAGSARRVFLAALVVDLGGLFSAILFGDVFGSLLAMQMQFWRTIWLLAALALFPYGLCVIRLGTDATRGPSGRVTLAILSFGLFSNPELIIGSAVAALALLVHFGKFTKTLPARYFIALGAAIVALSLFSYASTLIDFGHFLAKLPVWAALAVYCVLRVSLAALPICIIAVVWFWSKPRWLSGRPIGIFGGAVAAVASAIFWVSLPRTSNNLDAGLDRSAFASILEGNPGEVLWGGRRCRELVFARPPTMGIGPAGGQGCLLASLAMLWRERAQVLLDYGLASRNIFEPRKPIDDGAVLNITRDALDAFCARDDVPIAVIFPVEKNQPLAENLHASIWTPPHPRYVTDANDKMVWHEIDRYAGVPCGKEGRPNG